MAYALVNKTTGSGGANSATIAAGAASHTAGNLLTACICGDSATVTSVTDTAGNTYVQAPGAASSGAAGAPSTDIWYCYNCLGNASNAVTAHFSGTPSNRGIIVFQHSGDGTSDPFEASGLASRGDAALNTSSSFSPAAAGNVNLVCDTSNNGAATFTASAGFSTPTTVHPGAAKDFSASDNPSASVGAQTAGMDPSGGNSQNLSVASFALPSGASPPTVDQTIPAFYQGLSGMMIGNQWRTSTILPNDFGSGLTPPAPLSPSGSNGARAVRPKSIVIPVHITRAPRIFTNGGAVGAGR